MSKISIVDAVHAAWAFWRAHTREAAAVLSVAAAGGALSDWGGLAGQLALRGLGVLIGTVCSVMGSCALARIALADRHPGDLAFRPGRGGYQWTRQEWRVVGASCVIVLAIFAPILIIGFGGAPLYDLVRGGPVDPQRRIGVAGPILAVLAVGSAIYLAIRVFLGPVASLDLQRFTLAWSLTKGRFWPILFAYGAAVAPGILVYAALGAVVRFLDSAQGALPLEMAVLVIANAVSSLVQLPLAIGVLTYLFRQIAPLPDPSERAES